MLPCPYSLTHSLTHSLTLSLFSFSLCLCCRNQPLVHFVAIDTDAWIYPTEWARMEPQWTFLRDDLARVNRSVTPWVVVYGHRALYCGYDSATECGLEAEALRYGRLIGAGAPGTREYVRTLIGLRHRSLSLSLRVCMYGPECICMGRTDTKICGPSMCVCVSLSVCVGSAWSSSLLSMVWTSTSLAIRTITRDPPPHAHTYTQTHRGAWA
jgi:hypothetical protein